MMTYITILLLGLVLNVKYVALHILDETTDKMTSTEYGVSLPQNLSESKKTNTQSYEAFQQNLPEENRSGKYTAGNSRCRPDDVCGFHDGRSYSFCYVDYAGNWDYCCTGDCDYHNDGYLWCDSGNEWQYCGDAGNTSTSGRDCSQEFPCGMHQEQSKQDYYSCFVDSVKHWEPCCHPGLKCEYHGYDFEWCYTGYKTNSETVICIRHMR